MEELIAAIARGLVEDKESVSVKADAPAEDGTIIYHLHVAEDEHGPCDRKARAHRQGYSNSCQSGGYQKRNESGC